MDIVIDVYVYIFFEYRFIQDIHIHTHIQYVNQHMLIDIWIYFTYVSTHSYLHKWKHMLVHASTMKAMLTLMLMLILLVMVVVMITNDASLFICSGVCYMLCMQM